jgi:serine/threonine protein kinase
MLQAGQLFGNYRIVQLLGTGGFGEVYLAENPLIERPATIKVLHLSLAQDTESVRRFLNEARAASAIRHPNIIEVFDAGMTPEGAPYILMEFLQGMSLQQRLTDVGRLALPQVLEIATQAGSALAAAHAAGIVHRDLKPENLFLVPDPSLPGGERVKILDFGIAKINRSTGTTSTIRTQTGLIMGSPAYMSPEQCKDSADVDLRSDIYSLAIIVFEMLAGRPPYLATSGTELLVKHLIETPPPLSEFVDNVPACVETAIRRGLARERDERFDDVAAFVTALKEEAVASAVSQPALPGQIPVHLPKTSDDARSQVERPFTSPASTTFSRATSELAVESDDAFLRAARPRRWPLFAVAGLAGSGLALLLWGQRSRVPLATGSVAASVPTPAAIAPPSPRLPQDPPAFAAQVQAVANAQPADAGEPSEVAAVKSNPPPSPAGASPGAIKALGKKSQHGAEHRANDLPAGKQGSAEDEWIGH